MQLTQNNQVTPLKNNLNTSGNVSRYSLHAFSPPHLSCLKMYKLYLTNFQKRYPKVTKMCCTNIHLIVNPLTFNKYCMCNLLYIVITHNQNKIL